MVVISCADKLIIRDIQQFPEFFYFFCHSIHIFLRSYGRFFCFLLNLLTVLIKSSQIKNVMIHHTLIASQDITSNGCIGRSNMEFPRWVINRCRNVKWLFFSHFLILSRRMKPFLITPHYIIFHGVCEKIVTYSKHK